MPRNTTDPSQLSIPRFATPSTSRSRLIKANMPNASGNTSGVPNATNGSTARRRTSGAMGFTAFNAGTSGIYRPPFSIGPGESRGVICAVCVSNDVSRSVGLAFINVPIAEAVLTAVSDTQFYPKTIHKIQMMEASCILMPPTPTAPQQSRLALRAHVEEELRGVPLIEMPNKRDWSESEGLQALRRVAFKEDLPALEFAVRENFYTVSAFAAAIKHIGEDLGLAFDRQSIRIRYQPPADVMMISLPTIQSLELIQNARHTHSKDSLYGLLNRTVTPMGARVLRSNILQPSTRAAIINARMDAVEELVQNSDLCGNVVNALRELKFLGDVEQLLTKLVVLPKDGSIYESEQAINNILKLKSFLKHIPGVFDSLSDATSGLLLEIQRNCQLESANSILEIITNTIDHHADYANKPLELRNQRIHTVKHEVSANLDIHRKLFEDFNAKVHDYINNLEGVRIQLKYTDKRKFFLRINSKDIGRGGPPAVLVNRTRVKEFIECQTLKLVEYNERINQAVNGAMDESDGVIKELLSAIRPQVCVLFKYCESIALVDLLVSYASVARAYSYTRPVFQDDAFNVVGARHPILDSRGYDKCIPNSYFVTEETRFQIITGQNMSGKSTYIRAVAMIQIMAQIGCYLPAEAARLPILHNLFARVSTDDLLEANLSTFSVEMREMAFILRNINPKSLVIVDELGRATSTRDGLAIATAMSEALLQSSATVFFATHFIELAHGLANRIGVTNRHLETEARQPTPDTNRIPVIRMLYRVSDGAEKERSYGIALAKVIGFPESFIRRAEMVASELRRRREEANQNNRHDIEEAKRRKLVRGLVRQLQLAQQSQADDEELWQYLEQIRDNFWNKMLGASGDGGEVKKWPGGMDEHIDDEMGEDALGQNGNDYAAKEFRECLVISEEEGYDNNDDEKMNALVSYSAFAEDVDNVDNEALAMLVDGDNEEF